MINAGTQFEKFNESRLSVKRRSALSS